jgi:hypothetical protein
MYTPRFRMPSVQQGVFHGLDISAHAPNVGDIIQHNRGGASFSFDHARTHTQYNSHAVIVVEIGRDVEGPFPFCIGGNEGDAIRRTVVRLTPQGLIRQRGRNPFICVIKTLKWRSYTKSFECLLGADPIGTTLLPDHLPKTRGRAPARSRAP